MSPDVDDMINASRIGGKGVTIYFMKSVTVNEMNKLWATAMAREKSKQELSSGKLSSVENEGSKRTRENDEQNGNVEKKPRVVWTKEMHQKFLEAIAQLGHDSKITFGFDYFSGPKIFCVVIHVDFHHGKTSHKMSFFLSESMNAESDHKKHIFFLF